MKQYWQQLNLYRISKFLGVFPAFIFTSEVFAADAPAAAGGLGLSAMGQQGILLAAFALVFYFLFIRPQSKRAKEHQQLLSGLQKGDEVITTGGILGRITGSNDNFFTILVAEGVEISIQRQAIVSSLPKGTMKSIGHK